MSEPSSPVSYVTELRSLPDQIAEAMRESILSGALAVDQRLPNEAELAAQFGVSRPTVREALKRLAAKNLIRSQRGASGGNFVTLPSSEQVRSDLSTTATLLVSHKVFSLAEIAESRRLLETTCARLAAERRTTGHLTALGEALDRQARPDLSDEEFCDADVAFHRVIVQAAGNPVLDYVMVFALEALHPSTNLVINRFRQRSDVLALQQVLLDAVASGDPDAAEAAIHAQMDHLSGIYNEAQEWVEARRVEREDGHGRIADSTTN
jgi:GntR family transcriptional repressor for pyruvate dehydrogenase complex|tara:strand:+ start:3886 stop:4683 length:798 start_codon:yes stop_codon:yes gene_type:complete